MRNKGFKSNLFCLFYFFDTIDMGTWGISCSCMQHVVWTFDTFNIPWILQNLLFLHTSFWQESFLNISNHLLKSSPEAHLHIGLSYLVNPLIFADSCPRWHNYSLWGLIFQFHDQLALKFHWVKMCFGIASFDTSDIQITFKLLLLTMSL